MSARGLCQDCWELNETENLTDLVHHSGPWFLHWRRRMAAAVGGVLLDDMPPDRDTPPHDA